MEPPRTNMFPCSQSEHNVQAPQGATVIVTRKRVFPKGRGEACYGDRNTPRRHRRNMIMTPHQRVLMWWMKVSYL